MLVNDTLKKNITIGVFVFIVLFVFSTISISEQTKKSISFGARNKSRIPLGRSKQKPIPFKFSLNTSEALEDEKKGFEIGIKAGSTAGLSGALGEVSFSLNPVLKGAFIRGGVGYITGNQNQNYGQLKIATVNLDALYSLSSLNTFNAPLNVYIGGGFIYPVKVNREKFSGAWGAKAYLGSKYELQKNMSIYGEIAYTGLKYSEAEKAIKGMEAMLGYSYSF